MFIISKFLYLCQKFLTDMAPKKVTKKDAKAIAKPRKKFKYIKGYKELVEDPFNLK